MKNCPKCGGDVEILWSGGGWHGVCKDCLESFGSGNAATPKKAKKEYKEWYGYYRDKFSKKNTRREKL